jgi:co-chaperonin GroES (HSP10)
MQGRVNPTKILLKAMPKLGEKKTQSGIIIPDAVVKEPSAMGIVVVVGKGTAALPMEAQVGDKVLHSPHAVSKVVIPEREETQDLELKGEYYLLDSKDILLLI